MTLRALWHSRLTRQGKLMRILPTLAVAAGLAALAACNNSPTEQRADNIEANAENVADNIEANADNQTDVIENAADNQADAVRNAGDNQADAVRNSDDHE